MKKFFSLALALVMALSLTTVAWGAGVTSEAELETALAADGEVVLGDSFPVTDGVTVPAGVTVTLDLAGNSVTMEVAASAASALITNNGTLTIKDSVGGGKLSYKTTVVNGTDYSTSTIINNGVLTVVSGTIENTTTASGSGAVYGIDTYGTLTVNGGTISTSKGTAIRQAVFNYDNTATINGGTISSPYAGLQVHVFNDTVDVTTVINGGSFSGDYAFYTYFHNVVDGSNVDIDVNGGTFDGYVYLYNGNAGSSDYPLDVSISGGTFNDWVGVYTNDASGNNVYSPAISGGTFAVAPEAENVAAGLILTQKADGTYTTNPDTSGSATAALYDLKQADAKGTEVAGDISYVTIAATKNEATGAGSLEYIKMDGKLFVKIKKADATTSDFYVTKANKKTAEFYLKQIDSVADVSYEVEAKEFTKIGYKCDQMNAAYVDYVTNEVGYYVYTHPATGAKTYFADAAVTTGDAYYNKAVLYAEEHNILVDGEVITAYIFASNPLNQHMWAPVAYDKTTPVTAQCGICGAKAAVYKDGKAPAGSVVIDQAFNGTTYDLVITSAGSIGGTVVTPSTDKVESAETFDAGIAMYVGMSVMAAAGSAVVIGKKKD